MSRATAKKAVTERRRKARSTKPAKVERQAAEASASIRPIKNAKKSGEEQVKNGKKAAKVVDFGIDSSKEGPFKTTQTGPDKCFHCTKKLLSHDRALLVEEEIGRVFCSEECIASYFTPEIDRLEREYFQRLAPGDLGGEEREKCAHLRWITLEEPDEVWREKSLSGDYRYTLISEFNPADQSIWMICISLFLRGEPSFLYLAFPTKNPAMVDFYRRGERVEWSKAKGGSTHQFEDDPNEIQNRNNAMDGRESDWKPEESALAQNVRARKPDDIRPEEFSQFQGYLDPTLEEPDEVWSTELLNANPNIDGETARIFHFIKRFIENGADIYYVVIARETDNEDEIEIMDAFPTKDAEYLARYRTGSQEVGQEAPIPTQRVIH